MRIRHGPCYQRQTGAEAANINNHGAQENVLAEYCDLWLVTILAECLLVTAADGLTMWIVGRTEARSSNRSQLH